jgi:hypothetical protein
LGGSRLRGGGGGGGAAAAQQQRVSKLARRGFFLSLLPRGTPSHG